MIGHLEGLSSNSTVTTKFPMIVTLLLMYKIALTEKQKLALEQELAFRKQGFAAFSQETDPGVEKKLRQASSIGKG